MTATALNGSPSPQPDLPSAPGARRRPGRIGLPVVACLHRPGAGLTSALEAYGRPAGDRHRHRCVGTPGCANRAHADPCTCSRSAMVDAATATHHRRRGSAIGERRPATGARRSTGGIDLRLPAAARGHAWLKRADRHRSDGHFPREDGAVAEVMGTGRTTCEGQLHIALQRFAARGGMHGGTMQADDGSCFKGVCCRCPVRRAGAAPARQAQMRRMACDKTVPRSTAPV